MGMADSQKASVWGGGDLKRGQVQKLNSKRVDRPASGVAHKFPRRSYNLLLNYSLSRGAAAPPSHSLLSISPDIGMHASKIDAFAPANTGPDTRDWSASWPLSFISPFWPVDSRLENLPTGSPPFSVKPIPIDRNRPPFNSKIRHFRFLPLYPKPVSLVTAFCPMNRRIWFNQGTVPKKWKFLGISDTIDDRDRQTE